MPIDANNPEYRYYQAHPEWNLHGRPGAPTKEAIMAARDRVLARFPKLRVVGCHIGSNEDDLEAAARHFDAYPNLAVDTAAKVRYLAHGNRDKVREFLLKYQDRVLYATDFTLGPGDQEQAWKSFNRRMNETGNSLPRASGFSMTDARSQGWPYRRLCCARSLAGTPWSGFKCSLGAANIRARA